MFKQKLQLILQCPITVTFEIDKLFKLNIPAKFHD